MGKSIIMNKLFKKKYPVYNIALKSFIKDYFAVGYSTKVCKNSVPDLVPPIGSIAVHFSIGNHKFAYDKAKNLNKIAILGLQNQHIKVIPQPGIEIIGANFHPYGFYNLFGIPASKFTNSVVLAADIWDSAKVEHIQKKLSQVYNIEEGIYIIEKFFWKQRIRKNKYSLYFDSVAEKAIEMNGIYEDVLLLSNNSISRRSVERYFAQTIGCSPKRFANLQRHIFILQKMLGSPEVSLSQLVYCGQYYDFSHFHKDFKIHTGLTYKDYMVCDTQFARTLLSQ
jgi:AraC-like DNA-binding protein